MVRGGIYTWNVLAGTNMITLCPTVDQGLSVARASRGSGIHLPLNMRLLHGRARKNWTSRLCVKIEKTNGNV